LVGFFPNFFGIGDTLPLVKIARSYMKNGGKAIFFSHGGRFEHLADKIGCEVVKLQKFPWDTVLKTVNYEKTSYEKLIFMVYTKDVISTLVEEEIEAFRNAGIKLLMSSFNLIDSISARVLNIPSVVLTSGTAIPPFYKSGFVTFPENYENSFTKFVPSSLKNQIARWVLLNNKLLVKDFNKVAKKYGVKPFKTLNNILSGDYTFVCDDITFLGIQSTKEFPEGNFVGPILGGLFEKKEDKLAEDVRKHLERPGRSILFMMGTTHDKQFFLKILEILNRTDYNAIVACTTLSEESLPKTNDNILLKKFIKSPLLVNKMVDLAIIHGGRGTIYTAAYSGKPAIGIPLYAEHQYNIDNIVRNGAGLRISMKFFKAQDLLNAINIIFSDYDKYLKNAKDLAAKLTKTPGEEKAVKRLIEIIEENIIK
jgi:UDP:flavonoid glycosyltransferase YjiC (YdhE family)